MSHRRLGPAALLVAALALIALGVVGPPASDGGLRIPPGVPILLVGAAAAWWLRGAAGAILGLVAVTVVTIASVGAGIGPDLIGDRGLPVALARWAQVVGLVVAAYALGRRLATQRSRGGTAGDGHVIFSFAAPVALAEAWTPARARKPWLGPIGTILAAAAYVIAAVLIVSDPESRAGSPTQLLVTAGVVAAMLLGAALVGRKRRMDHARAGARADGLPRIPTSGGGRSRPPGLDHPGPPLSAETAPRAAQSPR